MRRDRDLENHMLLGNGDYFNYNPECRCLICGDAFYEEQLIEGFCQDCINREKTTKNAVEFGGDDFLETAYEYDEMPFSECSETVKKEIVKNYLEDYETEFIAWLREKY
jgi:hypothetical protein